MLGRHWSCKVIWCWDGGCWYCVLLCAQGSSTATWRETVEIERSHFFHQYSSERNYTHACPHAQTTHPEKNPNPHLISPRCEKNDVSQNPPPKTPHAQAASHDPCTRERSLRCVSRQSGTPSFEGASLPLSQSHRSRGYTAWGGEAVGMTVPASTFINRLAASEMRQGAISLTDRGARGGEAAVGAHKSMAMAGLEPRSQSDGLCLKCFEGIYFALMATLMAPRFRIIMRSRAEHRSRAS